MTAPCPDCEYAKNFFQLWKLFSCLYFKSHKIYMRPLH